MKNRIRFWVRENGGWIKLPLRKGEKVEFHYYEPDEEGFSASHTIYSFDGEKVHQSSAYWGEDCDGKISREVELECDIANVRSHHVEYDGYDGPDGIPSWEETETKYRDYRAESAGY